MQKKTRLIIAGCLSAGLHLFGVIPFGVARLLIDTTPELAVTFLPDDGPSDAPDKPEPPKPDEPEKLAEAPRPEPPKPDEPDEPEDPAKREEKPKVEPEAPKPPPLVVMPNAHLKMVDQEQFPDEDDNADANYLAQKNHRALQETQAEDRNLLRNQAGERQSSENQNKAPEVGDKSQKVAELMDRPGDPKHLPQNQMPQGETLAPTPDKEKPKPAPSLLAMRDVTPAQIEAPARDGLELPEPGAGPLPLQREGSRDDAQQTPRTGAQANLRLSHDDYERIVGFDVAQRERQQALSQRSQAKGRWEKLQQKLQLMRASLENFTPSVKPGNESELGTRRHPFAAYIAGMHRQIHKFWGFGYLIELDGKPANSPYNDMNLWTGLEIALREDGSVDKIMIEHPSGNAVFDTAAMDAVMSSAPYGPPPDVIKSRDGKVYISWRFHRDNRQCATDFVQPHILTTPGKPGGAVAAAPSRAPATEAPRAPAEAPRPGTSLGRPTISRELAGLLQPRMNGGGGAGGGEGGGRGASGRGSSGAGASDERGGLGGEGGGRGEGGRASSSSGGGRESSGGAGGEGGGRSSSSGGGGGKASASAVPQEARDIAQKWLAAYVRGDARWLAGYSALPFTAGGRTVADSGDELRSMYRQMIGERQARGGDLTFFTPAQARKRLGKLPAGGDEEDMMFAFLAGNGEDLVLLLQPADKGWRVVGIAR